MEVEVITAVKSAQTQIERVKTLIEKKYPGKIVSIKEIVKEEILGGFQVKVGSEIIDASLKNQLASIGKECLATIN